VLSNDDVDLAAVGRRDTVKGLAGAATHAER
jgi:hypothetical protein